MTGISPTSSSPLPPQATTGGTTVARLQEQVQLVLATTDRIRLGGGAPGCGCAAGQASAGVEQVGQLPPGTGTGAAFPRADGPVGGTGATAPTAQTAKAIPGFPMGVAGVSAERQQAARDASVSADGLVPQARRNLDRAWQWGLKLTGGVGTWNQWHADGSSIDVGDYAGGGVGSETPAMRAFADEMVALGRSGATGPDGGLLVTHVVYAGMKAGASTNWQWTPVSDPNDVTQGHWDHVHVETDSWV